MILEQKTKEQFGYTFETATVWKEFYCQCDYCGVEFMRSKRNIKVGRNVLEKESCNSKECAKKKREESQLKTYGIKNAGGTKESLEKAKKAAMERYGVENFTQAEEVKAKMRESSLANCGFEYASQSPEFREQVKQTCLEKYGVDNVGKAEQFKLKMRETFQQRYDVLHALQNPEFLMKFKQTCMEKFGVDNYSKTEECRLKVIDAFIERFGVDHPMKVDEIKAKSKQTCLDKYGVDHYSKTDEFKKRYEDTCLSKYGVHSTLMLITNSMYGKTQQEMTDWLNSYGYEFKSDRKILSGKEIDLYNEELKLGIEYCGLFWHNELSPQPRGKEYHYNKYKVCADAGITLITIFEDEWFFSQEKCKAIILSKIGKCERSLGARECVVKEIDKKVVNEFLEKYHLQGGNNLGLVSFGIFYNDELVATVSLGRHHRSKKEKEIVLTRMCFKSGVKVSGGAGKLLSACKKWCVANGYESIITWSDNRWSSGRMYSSIGFVLDEDLPPDYSYVDLKNVSRHSKQSKKKSNTGCPPDFTENNWMIYNGFARIWDCGKKRWKLEIK